MLPTVPNRSRLVLVFSILTAARFASIANAEMPIDRITQPIDNAKVTQLRGNIHPLARTASDLGSVSPSTTLERMKLIFRPTSAQQSALNELLAQQQDPGSPNYHKWLSPEQFADRFGLSQGDVNKVSAWLGSQGFRIAEVARSRTYIAFNGSAAQVQVAFHTPIHQYSIRGERHYANATEPAIPTALAGVVSGIAALNNFSPNPRLVKPTPRLTSSVTGNHFMQPGDFATIYNVTGLYNSGIDGTGQTIAVMGQTDLFTDSNGNFTDINTFRTNSGLSTPANLTVKLISSDPGITSGDIDEANLDVEWAGGLAKNAAIIYVNSKNGAFDSLQYAISNNVAPVISISYGLCEQQLDSATQKTLTSAGQQANAQGQTIVAPSGDSGAADCDTATGTTPVTSAKHGLAVDFPASMPYATSAGGSEFTGDTANSSAPCTATRYWGGGACTVSDTSATALSYIPEMVWNDTATDIQNGGSLAAGGGGLSTLFTVPAWQSGLAAISNGMRGVPDISFSASADHDGYLICSYDPTAQTHSCTCGFRNSCTVSQNTSQGTFDSTGGTSAAVPAFAAIVALLNQKMGTAQGNVNPALYALLANAAPVFHDITTGNNIVPCQLNTPNCPTSAPFQFGYSAAAGYDLASGLGSVDVSALATAWGTSAAQDFQLSVSPTTLSLTSGGTGSATINLGSATGFPRAVAVSCTLSSLGSSMCSISPSSVTPSGTATLTIQAATLMGKLDKRPRFSPGAWGMESSVLFAGLLLFRRRWSASGSRRPAPRGSALLTLIAFWVMLLIASCGGGGSNGQTPPPPTPLSGTVTVTATSGSLSHTSRISVTVN